MDRLVYRQPLTATLLPAVPFLAVGMAVRYFAAPCSWWGGPASTEQVADVERWWFEHRSPVEQQG